MDPGLMISSYQLIDRIRAGKNLSIGGSNNKLV